MEKNREKAWEYLTDLEKQSVYLTLGQGISGCSAGEILGLTHYKYLELKSRSETLFKIFSDYFEKHPSLVKPSTFIKPQFRDFIYGCLEKRLPLSKASIYAGEGQWSTVKIRNQEILDGMALLKSSTSEWDRDLWQLIIEFDRWNSFRILPYELQAPSPYKRKSNRQVKAYFKYLRSIPSKTLTKLELTLFYRGQKPCYIALIKETYEDGYKVIPIQENKKNLNNLSIQRIYIFPKEHLAEEFALMVKRQPSILTSKQGLGFWSEYSKVVQQAINYENIDHTTKIKTFYDEQFQDNYHLLNPPRKKMNKKSCKSV